MRPVSLRLHAFGSYAGELHVDFSRLSRHGIFAICGPTGAGKSTIFDALVYALYDDLPGFRIDGNVRSQYACLSEATWVTLDFVVHGELWRVDRRPTQLVRRRRGDGAPIEKKSTVVLGRVGGDGELLPGTAVTKKDEVKRRIDALVGLSKDQFEQVVLIPQGRFEEVLKADTSKRAPLLRRLFPVELFTRVTESLKSISSARQVDFEEALLARDALLRRLRDAYEAAVVQLPDDVRAALFGDCDAPELDVALLGHHVVALAEGIGRLDDLVHGLRQQADLARAQLDDGRRAAADWDRWQADLAASSTFDDEERSDADELGWLERGRRLADLRGALVEWDGATRRLAVLEPERTALVEEVTAAWPDDLDAASWDRACTDAHHAGVLAEVLASDARRLHAEIARFERLVETGQSLQARRVELEARRIQLAEGALKLDAEEQAVLLLTEEVQRLGAETAHLEGLEAAVEALEREHQLAARRASAAAELERFEAELEWASDAVVRAAGHADAVRVSWRDGLAGRLAQLLTDGAPCPTCGALEHPAPAGWRDDGADDEALAAAERARDEAMEVSVAAGQRAAGSRAVLGALSETRPLDAVAQELALRRASLEAVRDASARLAAIAREEAQRGSALREVRKKLECDMRACDADCARFDGDRSAHERGVEEFVGAHGTFETPAPRAEARAGLAGAVATCARILRDTEAAERAVRAHAAVLDPVARELGADGPGDLFSWLCEPAELESRSQALEQRRSRREDVRRRIAEYEQRIGPRAGNVRPEVGALDAAATAAESAHVSLVERRAVLEDRAAVLAAGSGELAIADGAVVASRLALEQAKTVADRCAGLGGGASALRLSLENWVLADYLRQVLVQANHRLDAMTDGRFSLELSDGVTDGRKPWGLDLAVFDANTGQVRPATTLSGGETFMAALALALGLADVVSGGSNRETGALFVDEGFGSLDPQSLDAVIDVLRALEEGGRVVGVISHVAELQRALPTGITVEPSPRGSVATVHYPPD